MYVHIMYRFSGLFVIVCTLCVTCVSPQAAVWGLRSKSLKHNNKTAYDDDNEDHEETGNIGQ